MPDLTKEKGKDPLDALEEKLSNHEEDFFLDDCELKTKVVSINSGGWGHSTVTLHVIITKDGKRVKDFGEFKVGEGGTFIVDSISAGLS